MVILGPGSGRTGVSELQFQRFESDSPDSSKEFAKSVWTQVDGRFNESQRRKLGLDVNLYHSQEIRLVALTS
jgi:hypothetical protein